MGNGNHQLETWKDCVDARRIKQQEGKNISFPSCRIEPTVNVFPSWLLPGCWLLLSLEGSPLFPPFSPPHRPTSSFSPFPSLPPRIVARGGRGGGVEVGAAAAAARVQRGGGARERKGPKRYDRPGKPEFALLLPPPFLFPRLASRHCSLLACGTVDELCVSFPSPSYTAHMLLLLAAHTHTGGERSHTTTCGTKKRTKRKKKGRRTLLGSTVHIDCYFSALFRRGCLCK